MEVCEKLGILIIDDDKINLMALNKILRDDYAIYTAKDGFSGIEMARGKKPDLILLDIVMPGMDGYEVLSILKKDEETWRIPVIIISGLTDKVSEVKGLSMEAADYISKPFVPEIVLLRVRNQMKILTQYRTIEQLSHVDQLTQLPNKRYFNQYLDMAWGMAIREQMPVSMLMADIDNFKNINDTYGHLHGDSVLESFAKTLMQALDRPGDFAARYGGEEFCVILTNTPMDGAMVIAEKIRRSVAEMKVKTKDGTETSITASIGVYSIIPAVGDNATELITKADRALYKAKEQGRNCVVYGI